MEGSAPSASFIGNPALKDGIRTGCFGPALGTTDMGIIQFNQVLAADRIDLDPLLEKKASRYLALQRQMWRGVCPKNARHWARSTK